MLQTCIARTVNRTALSTKKLTANNHQRFSFENELLSSNAHKLSDGSFNKMSVGQLN